MKQILITPIITEKAIGKIANGTYTFKVIKEANKAQVAESVSDLYKVKVTKVNMIKIKSIEKLVRGRFKAKVRGWKKAIVTLKKGQKIPGFEEK